MMRKIIITTYVFLFASISFVILSGPMRAYATSCVPTSSILGMPTWYKNLDGQTIEDGSTEQQLCQPVLKDINDIWKVVAAVLELLLRLASIIAIGFVVYGGVTYTLSQGSPDKTKQALSTIVNALVGLAISIISATLVGYIAGKF